MWVSYRKKYFAVMHCKENVDAFRKGTLKVKEHTCTYRKHAVTVNTKQQK